MKRQKAKGPVIKMRQYEVRGAERPTSKRKRKGRDGVLMPGTQLSQCLVMWLAGKVQDLREQKECAWKRPVHFHTGSC